MAGLTYREIGERLVVSTPRAYQIACEGICLRQGQQDEEARLARQLECARLDRLMIPLWPLALGQPADGDLPAIPPDLRVVDKLLKISARRSKLLALAMPVEVRHIGPVSQQDVPTADLSNIAKEIVREGERLESQQREARLRRQAAAANGDGSGQGNGPEP